MVVNKGRKAGDLASGLRELKSATGLSTQAIAQHLALRGDPVSTSVVASYLEGRNVPSAERLQLMLAVLVEQLPAQSPGVPKRLLKIDRRGPWSKWRERAEKRPAAAVAAPVEKGEGEGKARRRLGLVSDLIQVLCFAPVKAVLAGLLGMFGVSSATVIAFVWGDEPTTPPPAVPSVTSTSSLSTPSSSAPPSTPLTTIPPSTGP